MTISISFTSDSDSAVGDRFTIGDITYEITKEGAVNEVRVVDTKSSITSYVGTSEVLNRRVQYSVTSIGDNAFYGCTGLTSVMIPGSVTFIDNGAFSWCKGLTSVTIPDSVTSIGDNAFYGCTGLTSVTIPDSVTSIGDNAFYGCTGLKEIIVSEENTIYSSDNNGVLFNKERTILIQYPIGKSEATYIVPDSVTSIGSSAFFGCTSLTSVMIGNSVTSIGSSAFSGCTRLTSVTIPDSVTSIGDNAFYGCTDLKEIIVSEENTIYSSDNNGVLFNKERTILIQYPIGKSEATYIVRTASYPLAMMHSMDAQASPPSRYRTASHPSNLLHFLNAPTSPPSRSVTASHPSAIAHSLDVTLSSRCTTRVPWRLSKVPRITDTWHTMHSTSILPNQDPQY